MTKFLWLLSSDSSDSCDSSDSTDGSDKKSFFPLKIVINSKTQIVTYLTQIVTKLNHTNCDKTQKSNGDKSLKLKLWPN